MPAKPGDLFATLTKAAWQLRLSLALTGGAAAGAGLLLYAALALVLDNLLTLEPATRVVLLVGFLLALAATLGWGAWRLARSPLSQRRLAVRLERLHAIGDNRLINALHFAEDPALAPELRAHFLDAAGSACTSIEPRRLWDARRWHRALAALAVAGALLLGYSLFFGAHAGNALHRFLHPRTMLMPLNVTQFEVSPGDADLPEGADCLVRVRAQKLGQPVRQLQILLASGAERLLHPMRSEGEDNLFELRDLRADLRYRLVNGNDQSRWFTLAVRPAPKLSHLTLTLSPPAYSGLPEFTVPAERREVDALAGTVLRVSAGLPKGVRATWRLDAATLGEGAALELPLSAPATLVLDLTDAQGHQHPRAWFCQLRPRPDQPPRVRFLNRELNQRLGLGQSLTIQVLAEDDCGVGQLELLLLAEQGERVLKNWQLTQNLTRREELFVLTLDPEQFAANASYRIIGRAWDRHDPRQMGLTTAPLMLHVVDLARSDLAAQAAESEITKLYQHLTKALTQQKQLQGAVSVKPRHYLDLKQLPGLVKAQQAILGELRAGLKLAVALVERQLIRPPMRDGLLAATDGLAVPLVARAEALEKLPDDAARLAGLNDLVLAQADLIKALQRLLGELNREQLERQMAEQALKEDENEQDLKDKLRELKEKLDSFKDEQKALQAAAEALSKKDPEDWTTKDEELLGDLVAKQNDLANFFKAKFNDLSKLQNQDFSNSTMAEELVEMVEELQRAGAALENKHIEIATSAEEMGLEMAKSIETNLERWLADGKDSIAWKAEDMGEQPDIPLADLPAELTDIVGELIDEVSEMADVEDSSNSYMGSMDEGAGWGSGDGNLNNMSAKGITGNSMPNDSEVGGRSGEGRSGKSSGQFVEDEATGKGGRDTPTRLTDAPFEEGVVKDSSKDPQGGATGGGKQSGLGAEGLRGRTPDHGANPDERLPGQQAELRQRAEALMRTLTVHNLPTADLEDAIAKMGVLAQAPGQRAPGIRMADIRNDVLASLRDAQTALQAGVRAGSERSQAGKQEARGTLPETSEGVPYGYERSVQAYFRGLATDRD